MRAQFTFRVRLLLVGVVLVALVLVGRLYQLQIVHGASYREEGTQQYVRDAAELFERGAIYFSKRDGGRVAAAHVRDGYVLAINPSLITDVGGTYHQLAAIVPDIDEEVFRARATKVDDPYEEIAHHIDRTTAASVRALALPGVSLYREKWRQYPAGTLGAHTIGFVGYGPDGHSRLGLYGLERYWNDTLKREGDTLYVNFFAELFASVGETASAASQTRVGDVVTSIEPSVQRELDMVLTQTLEQWEAQQLAGIVLDPQTGDVIALSALPTYDPNTYAEADDLRVFQNPIVEDVYEMGSIIKPIAMAIGLDEGAITADSRYNDTGRVVIDGSPISNYDGRARGEVDMQEVLNQSLNVGMAFVAREVGGQRLGERMRELGFGEETGVDLPFEVRGLIDNLESPREVEYATAAFGQGIALTPIETARALAALGNGGYLVTPHIAQRILYEHGTEGNVSIDEHEQVFSSETSEEITRMLVNVVDDALRDGAVKKEHYSIAAKTGTAQIAKRGERGYYDDRFLHSFFGYFPAYDPQFLIFLMHTEPKGAQYASETLTDPFMQLVDFLINYYEIPPDR